MMVVVVVVVPATLKHNGIRVVPKIAVAASDSRPTF